MKQLLLSALLLSTSIGMDTDDHGTPSKKRSHDTMQGIPELKSVRGQAIHPELDRWKQEIQNAINLGIPDVCHIMRDQNGHMHPVQNYQEAQMYHRQIQERRAIREQAPDRSNLNKRMKFIEEELGLGIHQCFGISAEELERLTNIQNRLNQFLAHSRSITADAAIPVLSTYIGYKRPTQQPNDQINIQVVSIISRFIPTLEGIQELLHSIPDDSLAIAPKTALKGTKEGSVPELLERATLFLSEQTPEATYLNIQTLLSTIKSADYDIAHHRSGKTGVKGLTRLEALIGGYEFGSTDTFYPQTPSLYNIILGCNLEDTIKEQLIAYRGQLLSISRLITQSESPRLTNEHTISLLCQNNSQLRLVAQRLAEQHTTTETVSLTHRDVDSNLSRWVKQRAFMRLNILQTRADFSKSHQEAQAKTQRLDDIKRRLIRMSSDFMDRAKSLAPIIKILKSLDKAPALDLTTANQFAEAIENFLATKPGRISVDVLEANFGQYFQTETRGSLLEDLAWFKNEQVSVQDSAQTDALIASIVEAQQAHRVFLTALENIRTNLTSLRFNSSSDTGIVKTQFFLTEMLRPENNYMTLPSYERADLYTHALNALLDPIIWSDENRDLAQALFTTARDAYITSCKKIASIALPEYDEGESFELPGFEISLTEETTAQANSGFAPPPPPPSAYSWNHLQSALNQYLKLNPESKQYTIALLTDLVNTNLKYADATIPNALELKQKLGLN